MDSGKRSKYMNKLCGKMQSDEMQPTYSKYLTSEN